ncbi:MAG: hypothetical protein KDB40_18640 [Acidimicrobiales bacterium]|nr:hypothetical protein [Acidimicrobiales bacterium]MCB9393991.1 hypothetical protein [Acidimicrobiaceae bacterium]
MSDRLRPHETPDDTPFEHLLRERMHRLADHAPATVRSLDEVQVSHLDRRRSAAASRQDGRHRQTAGIGATVAALVGAIGFTAVALNGAGTAGAETPEDAVRSFLEAAEAEDVLGMIDVLDPAEVPALRSAVERGREDAVAGQLVGEEFRLDGVAGVDIEVADLALTTQPVIDGVVVVRPTGSLSWSFDPTAFPFGDELAPLVTDLTASSGAGEIDDLWSDAMLATIERDGRWYVSAGFTVAELIRSATDAAPPGAPLVPAGADTPEAAADLFWQRMLDLDLTGAFSLAAPGEGDALLAYGPQVADAASDALADMRTKGFDLSIEVDEYDVTGLGARRSVAATGFTISGTFASPETFGVYFDPTLPTVISAWDGSGLVVLDPGVAVPDTADGLAFDPGTDIPDVPVNFTFENEDGTVQPLPVAPDPAEPAAVTIRRSDGCATLSGPGAGQAFGLSVSTDANGEVEVQDGLADGAPAGWEVLDDGSVRTCRASPGLSVFGVIALVGAGGLTELPTLDVVEVDGRWYVSPLGSAAQVIVDLVRSVRTSGSLFDSPLGAFTIGADRVTTEQILIGLSIDDLTEPCRALAIVTDGIVSGIADAVDPAVVRACFEGPITADGVIVMDTPDPESGVAPVPATVVP